MLGLVPAGGNTTALIEYLKLVGCNSLKVAIIPENVLANYKLQMTPTTIIIGNDGVIQEAWAGKWTSDTLNDAKSIFGIEFRKVGETR